MKHFIKLTGIFFYTTLFMASCSPKIPVQTEFVIGTICTVNLFDKGTKAVYSEIFARLRELESILSANRDDTNIAKINDASGIEPIKAAPETLIVLQEALVFSEKTKGLFDPTVGPLVKAWNIGTEKAAIPTAEALKKALSLIDYNKVKINKADNTVYLTEKGMKLDLGAIAKGFAADEIIRILEAHHINKAIIDLGGNVFAYGEKAAGVNWTIGIRDPETNQGSSILTIPVKNKSIVTSGVYERYFEQDGIRYHHILDTHTGYPVNNELLSVTIVTGKSIHADALSTTTFILGTKKGMELVEQMDDVEAVFINRKHEVLTTSGLRGLVKVLDPGYILVDAN